MLPQDSPILLKIRAQFQHPTHCYLVEFYLYLDIILFSLSLPVTSAYSYDAIINAYSLKILFLFVHELFLLKGLSGEVISCVLFLQEEF